MEIEQKLEILRKIGTKSLIQKLHECETELEKVMQDQADFTSQSYEYTTSRGSECSKVKEKIAELSFQAPETNEAGKKTTVAEREAWLLGQRKLDKELSDALAQQQVVAFLQDDHQIKVEMAKRRLEGIKAVIALKTQQIAFLAGG